MQTRFELYYKGEFVRELTIHVPGDHNVMNALAAIAAARYSGVSWEGIEKGLDTFFGAIRRFEKIARSRVLLSLTITLTTQRRSSVH